MTDTGRLEAFNNDLLIRFEQLLEDYFDVQIPAQKSAPDVQYFADKLHLSPNYLSDIQQIFQEEYGNIANGVPQSI